MSATDTELQEQIARALALEDGYSPDNPRDEWAMPTYRTEAAAVLPIVRKAQAEAWEKGWETAIDQAPGDVFFDEWHYQTNPYGIDQEATR